MKSYGLIKSYVKGCCSFSFEIGVMVAMVNELTATVLFSIIVSTMNDKYQ